MSLELRGQGPSSMWIIWVTTAILMVFLGLRVYTRIVCVAAYGLDDTLYIMSTVVIVAFAALATVACLHGFGRYDLDPVTKAEMTFWRVVAQTAAMIATATSKASVGVFLLRLVTKPWHKKVVWAIMSFMIVLSLAAALLAWVSCTPMAYMWDDRIEDASCIDSTKVGAAMAMWTIVSDVGYAVLAWTFIWNLPNPIQEKVILGGSLGLGIFAAAAGALRLYAAISFAIRDHRDVPIAVIVWTQVELVTTLVCIGIPACLPLWIILWRKTQAFCTSRRGGTAQSGEIPGLPDQKGNLSSRGSGINRNGPTALYTIGGTPMGPRAAARKETRSMSVFVLSAADTRVGSRVRDDGGSDEVSLRDWDEVHSLGSTQAGLVAGREDMTAR